MRHVTLKQTRSLQRLHPWVYSGAVEAAAVEPGEIVLLCDEKGQALATAYASAGEKIAYRILDWGVVTISQTWWEQRLLAAYRRREAVRERSNAWHWVHGEGEGLPGLIVDYYDGFAILQAQTEGLRAHVDIISQVLAAITPLKGVYERSDGAYRRFEGLPPIRQVRLGVLPPEHLWVEEEGVFFSLNLLSGQKSGHYCDQREHRHLIGGLAHGRRVLDLCCHTGGFTLHALRQGAARVVAVDSSAPALDTLRVNVQKLRGAYCPTLIHGDAYKVMEQLLAEGELFDLIILDPPKLAPRRSDVVKAERLYKALNKAAIKLLRPEGGLLATFSCSSAIGIECLQKVVAWAGVEVGAQIACRSLFTQPLDHPISLYVPESSYLKGMLVERMI